MEFEHDRYLVDQLVRPMINLYRVTPLAAGETPSGPPIAFVRQKRMALKEDIRFFADENESRELFRLKARSMLDMGGSRYDISEGDQRIGLLWHKFKESLIRSTWHIGGADEQEIAIAHERSKPAAIARRLIDFVPYVGGYIPIPYNFDFMIEGTVVGGLTRKRFKLRDQYILDLTGDTDKKIDRRVGIALAIALDALQNR